MESYAAVSFPTCDICFTKYNHDANKPIIIMPCCHTFCAQCLNRLDQEKCPNCNGWISLKSVNWGLLNLIPEKKLKNNDKQSKVSNLKKSFIYLKKIIHFY